MDCGDGPFACPSGFTFSRFDSLSAVAADATGAHVVYAARLSSGQGKVYVRNSPDGVNWATPASTLDAVPTGHQWTPDIASADGRLNVVFYDSRGDPGYAPNVPPGNTATGANSGDVINTFLAQSTDGGATWSETQLSTHGWHVLEAMHGYIDTAVEEGGLDLFGKDAVAADLGQRHIPNLIARGLDLDELDGPRSKHGTQLRGNRVSLP